MNYWAAIAGAIAGYLVAHPFAQVAAHILMTAEAF